MMAEAVRMVPIAARRPNTYSESPIDRAAHRRDDAAWIGAALVDPMARFVPVWRSKTLAGETDGRPVGAYAGADAVAPWIAQGRPWAFLGLLDARPLFAIGAEDADDPVLFTGAPSGGGAQFADLRASTMAGLPPGDAAIAAHARALIYWRQRHRHCGVCGTLCEPRHAGNALHCPNCDAQHFPRTDPAVIMLVTRGALALLGHSVRFPRARMYSTLAGFVEPGETLEEAVRREVAEEVGVAVGAVYYHSSQPWPYPAQIMLGFHAEALSDAITIQADELRDARWFTRDELRDPPAHDFHLPPDLSIARRLIDDWIAAG